MVLLASKHVKPGLGLFAETLGPIVASGDFEVETANIAAVIFILDAQVGDGRGTNSMIGPALFALFQVLKSSAHSTNSFDPCQEAASQVR